MNDTTVDMLSSARDHGRFVDREADERRSRELVARLRELKFESPTEGTTLDILRNLRS